MAAGMDLRLRMHDIRDVAWGGATRLEGGYLTMDRAALAEHLLQDPRLVAVDCELARPFESCRIGPIFDVVEPRARTVAGAVNFPGALDPVGPVGDGSTVVLRGMAVTMLDPRGNAGETHSLLDLTGPRLDAGASGPLSRYAALHHLVLLPRTAEGLAEPDRLHALRVAVLRAAVYLARSANAAEPDATESFSLVPVDDSLSRVAYVYQLHSHQRPTLPGEPILYGDNARHLLPTLLHPNEVLDGAVLPSYKASAMETYGTQNHPMVLELYRQHGRALNFVGVVATVAHQTVSERERGALMASNLVAYALHANAAVFSKAGGGAPHVDMAQTAHRCERLGVKTALLSWDLTSEGGGGDSSALFNFPELDAIVNYGSDGFAFDLPPVERAIAPSDRPDAAERLRGWCRVKANRICGAMDQLGSGRLTAAKY
jgi:glycine reductase